MALKHVNAVVVGAGAGGGIVAKELAEAGLSVVLLERGKWYTAFDCRKDDLRNQRTSRPGQCLRSRRRAQSARGGRRPRPGTDRACRATAPTATTPPAWAAARFSYGAMAWRYMEKDFRMRSTYGAVAGQHAGRLAHQLRGPGALLRESGMGDRRFRRRHEQHLSAPRAGGRCPCRRCRPAAST